MKIDSLSENYLGEKIKALRKSQGLTLDDVAKKLKLSKSTISQWENGKTIPRLDNLHELARILKSEFPTLFYEYKKQEDAVIMKWIDFKSHEEMEKFWNNLYPLSTPVKLVEVESFNDDTKRLEKNYLDDFISKLNKEDIPYLLSRLADKLKE